MEEFTSAANHLASSEYIAARAKPFNREEFERALNEIPDVAPDEQDRL